MKREVAKTLWDVKNMKINNKNSFANRIPKPNWQKKPKKKKQKKIVNNNIMLPPAYVFSKLNFKKLNNNSKHIINFQNQKIIFNKVI